MNASGSQTASASTITVHLPSMAPPDAPVSLDEAQVLDGLRRGDESTFVLLVDRYQSVMLRLAETYVRDRAVAEEVVQDTWLAVLQGLDRFEGRSSLKTWMFHILANKAKTRASREGRTIAFSALAPADLESDERAVEPERFLPPDAPQWPGHWTSAPRDWSTLPEDRLLAQETRERVRLAIAGLPRLQQLVITLRDIEGWTTGEICQLLEITEIHLRVLLHRGRSKVRQALARYFEEE